MKIGIDSYSYHRYYGEVRPGEQSIDVHWDSHYEAVDHAIQVGAECLYLETIFLDAAEFDVNFLPDAAELEVGISWHHPSGLVGDDVASVMDDCIGWIDVAESTPRRLMRITAGTPETRQRISGAALCARLTGPLKRLSRYAAERGVRLALENHGDLCSADLDLLLATVDEPNLGLCLDTVNALRLGDDVSQFVRHHAKNAAIVQLKDAEFSDPYVDSPGGPITTALGEGRFPLAEYLDCLSRSGFRGPVCVELATLGPGPVDELALLQRSIKWLKRYRSASPETHWAR